MLEIRDLVTRPDQSQEQVLVVLQVPQQLQCRGTSAVFRQIEEVIWISDTPHYREGKFIFKIHGIRRGSLRVLSWLRKTLPSIASVPIIIYTIWPFTQSWTKYKSISVSNIYFKIGDCVSRWDAGMIGAGPLLQQPATGMKVSWYDTRPRKGITPSWVGFIGYKICRVRVTIISK